jgi:hypothetical protein
MLAWRTTKDALTSDHALPLSLRAALALQEKVFKIIDIWHKSGTFKSATLRAVRTRAKIEETKLLERESDRAAQRKERASQRQYACPRLASARRRSACVDVMNCPLPRDSGPAARRVCCSLDSRPVLRTLYLTHTEMHLLYPACSCSRPVAVTYHAPTQRTRAPRARPRMAMRQRRSRSRVCRRISALCWTAARPVHHQCGPRQATSASAPTRQARWHSWAPRCRRLRSQMLGE